MNTDQLRSKVSIERVCWKCLTGALVLAVFVLLWSWYSYQRRLGTMRLELSRTRQETREVWLLDYKTQDRQFASGQRQTELLEETNLWERALELCEEAPPCPDDHEIEQLKAKGLRNPVKDLAADLEKHPEVLPLKGSEGSAMNVYVLRVLNDRWILGGFSDGHYAGKMLLRYHVSP